jgi:hypothetical protein
MKRTVFFVIMILMLLGSLTAVPFTTLGNFKVPTAYALPHKMVEFSYVNYFSPDNMDDFRYDGAIQANGGLNFHGIGITGGVVYNTNKIAYGNLKIQPFMETENIPAIAIGMDNMFSPIEEYRNDGDLHKSKKLADYSKDYSDIQDIDDYIQNSVYVVISKTTVLRGIPMFDNMETVIHAGVGSRRFVGNTDLSKQLSGFFFGLEMNPSRMVSTFIELDGYNVNAGVGLAYQNYNLRVGAYRLEEMDRRDPKFAANLMYTFDHFSDIKSQEKKRQFSYGSTLTNNQGKVISRQSQEAERNPLMDKLEQLRADREKKMKELEEIRKILEEK